MTMITVRAAARVDLAGGSLDLWPVGQIIPGALTVNVAVSLAATVECRPDGEEGVGFASRDMLTSYRWHPGDPPGRLALMERICTAFGVTSGWSIQSSSGVPPGSGLGGSSALSASLALALREATGKSMGDAGLVATCRDAEAAHLRVPTGVQDFWPAVTGGVLAIHQEPGGARVEPLPISLRALAARLVVVYSGQSRLSADTNWSLMKRFLDGDEDVGRRLEGIAGVARAMRGALLDGDFDRAGVLMGQEWDLRKGLAEGIETPAVGALIDCGLRAGALGGKVCGAGGGGCLAFMTPEGARLEVEEALEREGARLLTAYPVEKGHTVEVDA
jgi:D-glycero-alpha-D-manno-heptose-7-phosphate kinase